MLPNNKRLTVFSIKDTADKRSVWVKAGSAWVNRDGSLNVYLDVLPLEGRLHVREWKEDARPAPGQPQQEEPSTSSSGTTAMTMTDAMGGH